MRIIFAALLVISLFIPAPLSADEKTLSTSEKNALLDKVVEQNPFFEILISDSKKFRKSWLKELTKLQDDKPDGDAESLAIEAGASIAMDEVNHYLAKADDAAVNKYFSFYADLMAYSLKDEALCTYLIEDKSAEVEKQRRDIVDQKYSAEWIPKMVQALSGVITSGNTGETQLLAEDKYTEALVDVMKRASENHGISVLQRATEIDDPTIPARRQCETMSWLFETINELPPIDKAMLVRTMFSDVDKDK